MARYRKIDTRIWNDEKFRGLTDDGKLVFFFLLTHPHMTSIGAMRGTIPGLAAEISWDGKRFAKAFKEAAVRAMALHDPVAAVIWLPKFIRYNEPENPNVLKAWASAVEMLPECELTRAAIQSVKDFAEGLSEPFVKALPEVFRQALRQASLIQEPEQEPEPEPEPRKGKRARARATPLPDGFAVSSRVMAWAQARGHDRLDEHFEFFVSKAKAKGYTYADWDEAFMGAVRDDWAGLHKTQRSARAGESVIEHNERVRREMRERIQREEAQGGQP